MVKLRLARRFAPRNESSSDYSWFGIRAFYTDGKMGGKCREKRYGRARVVLERVLDKGVGGLV
jgi:hypothetical protein